MIKIPDKKENMKEIYKNVSNINIDEQKKIWDERGKGYYGEFCLLENLYPNTNGIFKILMNLDVPVDINTEKTTEIDLIMIHETGLYVFECKHYKGTIYGNSDDEYWTQFFKTQSNEKFYNPLKQNKYHINALRKHFPEIPIYSCVIFTNNECELKIENKEPGSIVCNLYNIVTRLNYHLNHSPVLLSIEQIDDIFNYLSEFSPKEKINGMDENVNIALFNQWLSPITKSLGEERKRYIEETTKAKEIQSKARKSIKIKNVITTVTICFCLVTSILFCGLFKSMYQHQSETKINEAKTVTNEIILKKDKQIQQFMENIIKTKKYNDTILKDFDTFYKVTNVSISNNFNSLQPYRLYATLTAVSSEYGFKLTPNSQCIVAMSNGEIYRYDIFGLHLEYSEKSNTLAGNNASGTLRPIELLGITDNTNIVYAKLSNIECFNLSTNEIVGQNLEIELYDNNNIYQATIK